MSPRFPGSARRASGAAWSCLLLGAALLAAAPAPAASAAAAAAPPPPAPAAASAAPPGQPSAAAPAAAELARIADDFWRHQLEEDVSTRVREGLQMESLPDLSAAHAEKEAARGRALRARLAHIDPVQEAALGHQDWLTLALLRDEADGMAAAPGVYWHLFLATPYDAPFAYVHDAFAAYRFASPADLEAYLRLLHGYAAMVGQLRQHLEGQSASPRA